MALANVYLYSSNVETSTKAKHLLMKLIVYILLIIPSCLWRGYVLSVIWKWMIISTFHAPELTIPQATGVGLVVSFLTASTSHKKEDERDEVTQVLEVIAFACLYPLFTLAACAVVRLWL